MKKVYKLLIVFFIFSLFLLLTGCTKTISYTYKIETGDDINVELTAKNSNYRLSSDIPFKILKIDKELSIGTFLTNEGYEFYKNIVNTESDIEILEESEKGEIVYTFFAVNNEQFIYLIYINNSSTGILLQNDNSIE